MKKIEKKKENKRYIPFAKTIVQVLSVLMIIAAILIIIYTVDYRKFKKLHDKTYDDTYVIHVLYLVMDIDNVPKDIKIAETFHGDKAYDDHILTTTSSAVPLIRHGDYLYADLDKYTNPALLKHESDYAFTKTNVNGEVIDGCYYNKKKNLIRVPASYFEDPNNDSEMPIQLEIETLMKPTDIERLKTNVNIKKLVTKTKTVENNGIVESMTVDLKSMGIGKIKDKDVHIYVNKSKEELDEQLYTVEDNVLEMFVPALQIRHLDIKVDYTISNVLAYTKVSSKSKFRAIKVSGPLHIYKGKIISLSSSQFDYCTHGCFKPKGANYWAWKSSNANYYYTYAPFGNGYAVSTSKSYTRPYTFRIKLSALLQKLTPSGATTVKKVGTLGGTNQTWLAFYCVDHVTKNGSGDLKIKITGYTWMNSKHTDVVVSFKSTEARGGQHAAGYLRFKWDDVGIKVKKTDEDNKGIKGLTIYAKSMDGSTTASSTTDASGTASFGSLNKSKRYKFYEKCSGYSSGALTYNGKTGSSLSDFDIYCVYPGSTVSPEGRYLDNNGLGYEPNETTSSSLRSNFLFIGDEFYSSLMGEDDNGNPVNMLYTMGEDNTVIAVDNSSPTDWKDIPISGSGTIGTTNVILPSADDVSYVSVLLGAHGINQVEDYKTFLENLHNRYPGNGKIIVNSLLQIDPDNFNGYNNQDVDTFNTHIQAYCIENAWCTYLDVSTDIVGEYEGYNIDGESAPDPSEYEGDDEGDDVDPGEGSIDDPDDNPSEDDPTGDEGEGEAIVDIDDPDAQDYLDYSNYRATDTDPDFVPDGQHLNSVGRDNLFSNLANPEDGSGLPAVASESGTIAMYSMENVRYRMCLVASKTKGTSKRPEKNTSFRVQIASGKCRNYPNGYDKTFVTGNGTNGELGYINVLDLGACDKGTKATVTIVDDAHKRTVIGDDHQSVSLVRAKAKVIADDGIDYQGVHYAKGDTIVMKDDAMESAIANGLVEETCPKTAVAEFEDKGYIIYFRKFNHTLRTNGEPSAMANIKFSLKKGSQVIRVLKTKFTYTDVADETHTCYEYTDLTDNTTTAELETDNNGMVCVYNLPDTDPSVYTITELPTDVYDNEAITATSSEEFSNYTNTKYPNYEYLIDWNKKEFKNDKTSNSNGDLKQSKFTVKESDNTAVKSLPTKQLVYDKTGNTKTCYVVDLVTPANNTNSVFESDNDGYVCIVGLKRNMTYTITETDPAKYYGYSRVRSITEESKLNFNTANPNTKTVYQCPTEVKITKTTTELNSASDAYKKVVYEELQKLTFNVLDSNGNVLTFKYNSVTNHYEYQQAVNDLTGTTDAGVTELRLLNGVNVAATDLANMNLNIILNYLPEGNYTLREVSSISCGSTGAASDGSNCSCANNSVNPGQATSEEAGCSNMGYAHVPDIPFTVTDENTADSVTCDRETDESVKLSLTNKPTEVKFTKKDFYGYYDETDVVKFENDEEIEAFDNITFRVRKQSTVNLSGISSIDPSVYEWFYKTKDGEYRLDVLHKCTSEGQVVGGYTCTQNLHTDEGDILLTHLCKCESYYIEEYQVPDGTVFILPKCGDGTAGCTCAEGFMKVLKDGKYECHPIKGIKVCDCDDDDPQSSPPVIIEDLPTKQAFIKKDLKYNTIITDQRTTFELFLTSEAAEAAGRTCNPYDATSKANDCIQVYFSERVVLPDEADGSYSYRMNPDQSASNKIKELHVDPNTGKLIFRYLPSYVTREYVLMETKAPRGYDLPSGEKSVTRFKVLNDTVDVQVSNLPNKPSKVIIGKYDIATGKLIPGFKFKVYKVNNYDENLTPMMQSKTPELTFKTIRDGSYEYRDIKDSSIITTCIDSEGSPCSAITYTLVDDTYEDTVMGQDELQTTIKEGQALIQYLDTAEYYVVEEVEAPKGYSLPERESDRFTLFYIPESDEVTKETKVFNTETFFTFFKYDEFNNVKDGAVFKLQKLNNDKIYEDVTVEDASTEDTKMYRVSSETDNLEITTLNGQATIYRLTEGQYRIIEIKAPEGYELPKKTYNVVTFLVDKKGHTYGSNIIANKKKTTKIEIVPSSEAELVVNIQTGKTVVKYGLIITGILGLVSLLIYIRKKVSK